MRPSLPEGYEQRLKEINERLSIEWNPQAQVIERPRYTTMGELIPGKYEGRFEIYCEDRQGEKYLVMTVEDATTEKYHHPDELILTWLRVLFYEDRSGKRSMTLQDLEKRMSQLNPKQLEAFFRRVSPKDIEAVQQHVERELTWHLKTKVSGATPSTSRLVLPKHYRN